MAKNIVIFSDGTGQDGGVRPDQRLSNVYKLYRAARVDPLNSIDPAEQVAFYDPGLGTDDDVHGFGRVSRTIGKLLGSVAGRGIGVNIVDCYEFIINHWEPGDRIYILGFSRGAYTARCVAQVVAMCGAPVHEAGSPEQPFRRFSRSTRAAAMRAVHQVYEHGAGHPRAQFEAERDEQARRFRRDYGSETDGGPNATPYFVGVFDTVAALGAKGWKYYGIIAILAIVTAIPLLALSALLHWVFGAGFWLTFAVAVLLSGGGTWLKLRHDAVRFIDDFPTPGSPRRQHSIAWHADNYDRGLSGHVGYARQASAIDEDRADFPRVAWGAKDVVRKPVAGEPLPLVQLWFAGNHSDIGGSYPESQSRLSDIALEWMADEASSLPHPLLLDRSKLSLWPDHAGVQHSEVIAVRDSKLYWVPSWAPAWLRNGWPFAARTPSGSPMHPSVHARFAQDGVTTASGYGPYRPPNLADDARFAHFYDQSSAATEEVVATAGTAIYRFAADHSVELSQGSNPQVETWLRDRGATSAAVISVAPWTGGEADAYRDQLFMRYLVKAATRAGYGTVPVEIRRGHDPLFERQGVLLIGVESDTAAAFARLIGQTVFLALAVNGDASVKVAFAAPAPA